MTTEEHDELDELRTRVSSLSAENRRLEDQAYRRDRDLREWEKRVVSARRRELENDRIRFADVYINHLIEKQGYHELRRVIEAVSRLPERPRSADVATVKQAAHLADVQIHYQRSESAPEMYRRIHAEVARLREYITTAGRALHATLGEDVSRPTNVGCTCPGCELIIGMDVLGDEEPAPARSA